MLKVKDILKTDGIIKISVDDTLAKALSRLSSSHDAAYVFSDDGNKFLGVVNPYFAVIKSTHPGSSKVENVLFNPPKLKVSDDLSRAARLMIESKVHYLPVFDEKGEKFLGIATARRILRKLVATEKLSKGLQQVLGLKRSLVTIFENSSVTEALKKFQSEKVSKLVVVDSHGKLRGILAYFDLIPLTLFPKQRASFGDKAGEKQASLKSMSVKNVMKSYVLTLPLTATLKQAAELILQQRIGSVVIVDSRKKPVNIITTRDLLQHGLLTKTSLEEISEVELENIREKHLPFIKTFVEKLLTKAKRRKAKVKVFFEEEKLGGVIKAKIQLQIGKEIKYFTKEDKNIKPLLEKLDKAIEEEL